MRAVPAGALAVRVVLDKYSVSSYDVLVMENDTRNEWARANRAYLKALKAIDKAKAHLMASFWALGDDVPYAFEMALMDADKIFDKATRELNDENTRIRKSLGIWAPYGSRGGRTMSGRRY